MTEQEKKKTNKKITSAREVAEAMAANLAANRADPEFDSRRERIKAEATRKVIEKRKLRKGRD